MANLDFGLYRNFSATERVKIQFRAEAFNLSNTPHFSNPAGNVTGTGFMTITSTNSLDSDAGAAERKIRFGLRLSF